VAARQKTDEAPAPLPNGVHHETPPETEGVARGDFKRRGWNAAEDPTNLSPTRRSR